MKKLENLKDVNDGLADLVTRQAKRAGVGWIQMFEQIKREDPELIQKYIEVRNQLALDEAQG